MDSGFLGVRYINPIKPVVPFSTVPIYISGRKSHFMHYIEGTVDLQLDFWMSPL
jgi:hypothetical protein